MSEPPTAASGSVPLMTAARDDVGRSLLSAAHAVLAEEGPSALTVRRIAAAAGVSTMNVYSRFGGKDGVVEELFIDGFRRLCAAMEEQAHTDDPIADLRRCRERYRRFALDNPTYYAVMFERVVPDFEPGDRGRAAAHEALGGLVGAVQRAIDAGQMQVTNPWLIAVGLWSACHGLVSLELKQVNVAEKVLDPGPDIVAASDWDRVYGDTLDRLLAGYMRPLPEAWPPASGRTGRQ